MAVAPPAYAPSVPPARRRRSAVGRVFWALFSILDLPLLLLVAAAVAAPHLHPGPFWWAQLAAAGLPYLALPLVAAALVPVLMRRWGSVALHLALLAAVAWQVLPLGGFSALPEPRPDDLVLMTFNVPQSGPSREALQDSVVALVEDVEPHLVGLQESWVAAARRRQPAAWAPQVEAVTQALPYALAVPAGLIERTEGGRPTTEVPLLVRADPDGPAIEVLEQAAVALGPPEDGDISTATRTLFRWRGSEGVHYNTHLRSYGHEKPWEEEIFLLRPGTWLPFLRRYRDAYGARAVEVEALVDRMDDERLPVLVSGDFNEAPYGWAYRRLRAGRTDAWREVGRGDGRTYHGSRPLVRIDYVMADSAWEVVSAEVPPVGFSDHRPVVVRLRWREEGGSRR